MNMTAPDANNSMQQTALHAAADADRYTLCNINFIYIT